MQFTKRIGSAGSTAFYFTDSRDGGMSNAQQIYLADRIMSYRTRFASLAVNAVWDFGMEEGDPVRSDKYGEFELCRDNAVYNAQMLTISFNHARLRKMNCEADPDEIAQILAYHRQHKDLCERALEMQAQLLAQGIPWPKVGAMLLEKLGITPCAENALAVTDRYFADVQAIRMLENTESLERLTAHEIGHMLSEESGAVHDKRIRKLFGECRDGFENLYEFCAECFMASELTDGIDLADRYRSILETIL